MKGCAVRGRTGTAPLRKPAGLKARLPMLATKGKMIVLGSHSQLISVVGDDLDVEVQGGHTTVTWETREQQETAEHVLGRLLNYRYAVFAPTNGSGGLATVADREQVKTPIVGEHDDLMVIPPMAGG